MGVKGILSAFWTVIEKSSRYAVACELHRPVTYGGRLCKTDQAMGARCSHRDHTESSRVCRKPQRSRRELVMLPLNPHIQNRLMIIPLPPRPLQPPHLPILQLPPHHILQFLPTNLLPRPRLLIRLQPRLEARLHLDPERRIERYGFGITSDFRRLRRSRGLVFGDGEEFLALGLDGECTGCVGGGDTEKGFFGGDGFVGGGEDAEFVAAEVSGQN